MVTSKNNIPKGCLSSFHAKIVTDERKRENTRNLERETTKSFEGKTQRPLEREVLEKETNSTFPLFASSLLVHHLWVNGAREFHGLLCMSGGPLIARCMVPRRPIRWKITPVFSNASCSLF